MAYDKTAAGLPIRPPGHQELAEAEAREADRIIAERDDEIAAEVAAETPKGGLY